MIAQKFTQPLSPDACESSPELLAVQDLMPISAEDKQALRESIKRDGIREPLRGYWGKDKSGKRVFFVLSGLNRLEIARELKLATVPVEAVEIDKKNREAFAEDENLARRQLSIKAKKNLAARRLKKSPNLSDRQIAARYGLDNKTVAVVRAELVARGEIPHAENRTDSKGRKQPANKHKDPKETPSDSTGSSQSAPKRQGQAELLKESRRIGKELEAHVKAVLAAGDVDAMLALYDCTMELRMAYSDLSR